MNTAIATVCLTLITAFVIWLIWPKRNKVKFTKEEFYDNNKESIRKTFEDLTKDMVEAKRREERNTIALHLLPHLINSGNAREAVREAITYADEFIRQTRVSALP